MKSSLETILLIDDDPISNYITEELLREQNYCDKIVTVTDGRQGLHFLEQAVPCTAPAQGRQVLVLLDLNMPMMDGFEFMEELQAAKLQDGVVVAVLTSSDNHKDISQANKYGFAAYLQKPLIIDEINNVLQQNFTEKP